MAGGMSRKVANPKAPDELKPALEDNVHRGSGKAGPNAINWEVLPCRRKYHPRRRERRGVQFNLLSSPEQR